MVGRGAGRSAVAASAYLSCSRLYNDYDGIQHDYTKKQGLVWQEVFLPEYAPQEWQDREKLWNAVEEVETAKDSRLAREFVVALPIELSREQQIELLQDFIREQFVSDGMCADAAIHDTDGHNPHAHILLTVRPLDERGKWQYKTEKEYLCMRNGEERGFTAAEFKSAQNDGWEKQYPYKVGKKKVYMTPSAAEAQELIRADKHPKSTPYGRQNPISERWNSEEQLVEWRKAWADVSNRYLERYGHDERIDHRSNAARGLDEIPTIHEGVTAQALERKGIVSDRCELNRQISDTFENCGLLGKTKASQFIASSGTDLVKKLQGNPSFVFTLIQKFNLPKEPPIYPDHDILILSDEAHRSQYGIFADNMMHLLPTASRIGFTGTPLLADDHITERTFGGYLSVYDFKRAVEDGATVPLYYENRADKIAQLDKPEITGRILDAIEAADLDPSQEEKLEREFAKEIHILTADERLRSIAKDFVEHYSDLWTSGKAMFVCLNKVTCVRMYNYVQEYWRAKIRELEARQGTVTQQEAQELARKLAWMKETEMAVVISQEQNEVQTFKKWGLDILPHRAKMEKRELDKEFKDSKNPFRVVFVCAMWLTGFDVKCLSCLYLDKPLKAHTLMQTIARANRVSEGKSNGLIVDYIGIVKALRKALADYTVSKNSPAGIDPTVDKTELIQRIRTVIGKTDGFLAEHGFRLQELVDAQDFEKMSLVQDAVNAMCETLETKKTFQTYASELARLFRYADRDDVDDAVRARKNAILAIYEGLQQKRKHADNTDLMVQINGIVNEYIHVEKPDREAAPSRQFDISKIDFDLLSREFAHTRRKNLLLRDLDELVNQQLAKMLFANPQRIDYYDRYQEIIDAYNAEQNRATIEKTFMDLMELASSLDTEQQRYVREGFSSDEELSVYDLLFSENLTKQEIETIKKVSVDLLTKIKQQIAKLDHWTDKQETKAIVDNLIRNTLWQELPNSYDVSDIQTYQKKIYEYVYMRYPEVA